MQLVIATPEDADLLRLVLERGLQALGSPDVASEACRRQKELARRMDARRPTTCGQEPSDA